ncbi:hypothetical protein [Mobiluncus mulieris]|uniref:hypothetical protein n=1 Tax=Mobiluncus mulieris TaxID=2052 RepID=UPI00243094C2|nr:hypothetical protein [Mobiluncus mulieris]
MNLSQARETAARFSSVLTLEGSHVEDSEYFFFPVVEEAWGDGQPVAVAVAKETGDSQLVSSSPSNMLFRFLDLLPEE